VQHSNFLLLTQSFSVQKALPKNHLDFQLFQKKQPYHLLNQEKHINTCPFRLTATAGTKFGQDFLFLSIILKINQSFQLTSCHTLQKLTGSSFSPIVQYSWLLLL